MERKEHWENVYSTKATTEVSWYQVHATTSLRLIREAHVPRSAAIIDVGGGASALAGDLLGLGFEHLTVLDLSGAALAAARSRLGDRASGIQWVEGNVLAADLPAHGYDLWHDRALFHFLTGAEERQEYVRRVREALKPGGMVIVATFAEDGPAMCSGLPVMRYSADQLHAEFGESFELLGHEKEFHRTPGGKEQRFVYCLLRRAAGSHADVARAPR